GKLARFPPRMHYQVTPDNRPAPSFPRSHLAEAVAKAKAGGGGSNGGTGRGLVGQIIPIYGFGIFLYILYILFKVRTTKIEKMGKTAAGERKYPPAVPGNMKRKITDYELAQLQEKLRETEEAMEKLINRVGPNCESRAQNVTTDQEKRLLQQLREITRVMKEGKFIDGISPEKEAEEAPYMEDWEGYPEETYPIYDNSDCLKRKQDTILVDYPDPNEPSAEELAERMEAFDTEAYLCKESLLSNLAMGSGSHDVGQKMNEVTGIADQDRDLCGSLDFEESCCCCEEDSDPAILAENAGFQSESCSEAEEPAKEDLSGESDDENTALREEKASDSDETGTLRKRNPKALE
ncbi:RIC3 protein, partial [Eudromia elegans]|nr:RIC3 protein [Eudromia elegans]